MNNEKKKQWSTATTDMSRALLDLMNCISSGYNAWISIEKNGEQEYPIKCVNPELDDPFNWTSRCGTFERIQDSFINDTQKDLEENWIEVISTETAANAYKSERKLLPGLINPRTPEKTVRIPVRKEDANEYRATISKDNYTYGIWHYLWEPKEGIPYYVVNDTIDTVYVVYYSSKELSKAAVAKSLRNTALLLNHYADKIESGEESKSLWDLLLSGESECGYDVYDNEQDISITAVPISEEELSEANRHMNEESYIVLFTMELFKRVRVMAVTGKYTIKANWSDLICKNRSVFQSIEESYGLEWNRECDEEQFVIAWLHRLEGFVCGTMPIDMYKELYEFVLKMVPVVE